MKSIYLMHHGILGQKWGIRRYQNADGSLTSAGRKRYGVNSSGQMSSSGQKKYISDQNKADKKWAKTEGKATTKMIKSKVQSELNAYQKELASSGNIYKTNGKLTAATINAYNKRMAQLMNEVATDLDIRTPSGNAVAYIAERGQIGVHTALVSNRDVVNQFKNGIWDSGRIAYKSKYADRLDMDN